MIGAKGKVVKEFMEVYGVRIQVPSFQDSSNDIIVRKLANESSTLNISIFEKFGGGVMLQIEIGFLQTQIF